MKQRTIVKPWNVCVCLAGPLAGACGGDSSTPSSPTPVAATLTAPALAYGLPTPPGTYAADPRSAYLVAPVGRSGGEAASIAGTIYRNVWLSNRPRPESLGSALR